MEPWTNLRRRAKTLSAIVNKAYIIAAQNEWNLAVQFAQQLSGMAVPVEAKTLPMAA
jgi:hypothetical protein